MPFCLSASHVLSSSLSVSESGLDLREVGICMWPRGHCSHCAAGSKPVLVWPEIVLVGLQHQLMCFLMQHVPTPGGVSRCGILAVALCLGKEGWFPLQLFQKMETKLWTSGRFPIHLISGCFHDHDKQKNDRHQIDHGVQGSGE